MVAGSRQLAKVRRGRIGKFPMAAREVWSHFEAVRKFHEELVVVTEIERGTERVERV